MTPTKKGKQGEQPDNHWNVFFSNYIFKLCTFISSFYRNKERRNLQIAMIFKKWVLIFFYLIKKLKFLKADTNTTECLTVS